MRFDVRIAGHTAAGMPCEAFLSLYAPASTSEAELLALAQKDGLKHGVWFPCDDRKASYLPDGEVIAVTGISPIAGKAVEQPPQPPQIIQDMLSSMFPGQ